MTRSPRHCLGARAQGVERHQHRRAGHGQRRDQRRDQAGDRDRHRDRIVDRRRATDSAASARARGARSRPASSTGASRSPRNTASACACVRSAARDRRHRDMGGGERRRVVEAVADHQHAGGLAPSALRSAAILSAGFRPPLPLRDAERLRDRRDRLGAIAGQDVQIETARRASARIVSTASGRSAWRIANTALTVRRGGSDRRGAGMPAPRYPRSTAECRRCRAAPRCRR